jgi:hypothetical protein
MQHHCRLHRVVDEVQSTKVAKNNQHAVLCKGITQMIDRDGRLTSTKAIEELASLISMAQAKGRLYCV